MNSMTTPVIDGHAHIFERSLPMVEPRRYTPDRDALLADYLTELDHHGFTHGVLVQPSFLGDDNRYLLAALAASPDRLRGVVVVRHTVAEDELRRMAAVGVVGVRLNLIGADTPDFNDPAWVAFLERLRRLGLHIELTCAAAVLETALPPLLNAGCDVVVDHFGRPDGPLGMDDPGFQCLLAAGATGHVWVKLSAMYRMVPSRFDAPLVLDRLSRALGRQRLVWGSDWPHTHYTDQLTFSSALALIDGLGLTPEARSQVLGASACSLFRIGAVHV
ncbi:MAG: putative hydrolase, Amidohydrolase 2 motif protein [Rhodoferax sp.]|nr:putative hydrolase, Amidohydrolase 2 motif protein [Rhodoferax sp.]